MRFLVPALLLIIAAHASAQNADAIYLRACGPKDTELSAQPVSTGEPQLPQPGKALVYFVQDESGTRAHLTSRVGLDGSWVGALERNSYFSVAVTPGKHHACVAMTNRKHPNAQLIQFTVKPGDVKYYRVRAIVGGEELGSFAVILFGPVDKDETRYLIASDPQIIATPKP